MDANRFDRLARALTTTRSRRGALAALLRGSAAGGLLGGVAVQETDAHDLRKKCEKYKGIKNQGRKKKCLKQAKKHNVAHAKQSVGIRLPPPPPVCSTPSRCQSDADCCGSDFCSCGEPHVCVQAGSLGTGACCKRNEECRQDCVLTAGAHGVCCDPADTECVCANCPACVAFGGACTESADCCDGVPCTGDQGGANRTCRYS